MNRMFTGMIVLTLFFAGGFYRATASAENNTLTFKNTGTRTGNHVLYIEIVPGACNAPSQQRDTSSVDPNSTRTLSIPGNASSACWIASTYSTVSAFPIYCGDAKAGEVVTFSKNTAVCDLKIDKQNKFPKYEGGVVTRAPSGLIHLEYYVTAWNDPLTPPHTTTQCIGNASGHWPWCDNWSTCNQWETQCQFLRNEAYLVIDSPTDVKTIVDNCLTKSVCAAALSGVAAALVTAGAALPAAEQAFVDVMLACLADAATNVSIRFDIRSHWTPYGSCTRSETAPSLDVGRDKLE